MPSKSTNEHGTPQAGHLAHELNNVFTVILGNLQMLQERATAQGDAQSLRMIEAALGAAERGADLGAEMLAKSRTAHTPKS